MGKITFKIIYKKQTSSTSTFIRTGWILKLGSVAVSFVILSVKSFTTYLGEGESEKANHAFVV